MTTSNFGDLVEPFFKIRHGCADHLGRDSLECCSYQGLQVVQTIIVPIVDFSFDVTP